MTKRWFTSILFPLFGVICLSLYLGKPLFADPEGVHQPPDFKSVKEYALAKGVVSAALKQAQKTSDPKEKEALESYAKMLSGRIEGVETEVLPWLKKTLSDFEKFIGLDYFFDLIASEKSEEKKGMLKAILVEKEGLRFSEIEKEYEYLKSLFSNHPLFIEMKQQTGLLRKAAEFGEEGDRASFEKILEDTVDPQLKLLLEITWKEAEAIRAKREEIKGVLGSEEIDLNRYIWGAQLSSGESNALYYEKVNRVLPGIKPALTYLLYQQIRDRLPEGRRKYIENEFEKLEISQTGIPGNDWPIERNFFQEELFFYKMVKLYIETLEREASILSAAEENRARILINKKFDAGLYLSGTPTTLMPLSRPTLALTAEALFIASLPYLAFYATQIEVVSIASLNLKATAGIAALTALFTAAHYGDHYLKYDRFPDENVFIHFGRNLLLMLPLGAAFKALYLSYPIFTSVLGGTVMGLETKSHYESQEYLQTSLSAVLTLAMAAQGARRFGVEAKPKGETTQGQTNETGVDPLLDIPPKNRWKVNLYERAKSWGEPSFLSSPRPIPSVSGQPSGATALLTQPQLGIQPKTYKHRDILTFVEPMLPKTKAAAMWGDIKNGVGLEIDLKVFPIAPQELQEILPILSGAVDDEKVTDGVGDKVFTKKDGKKVVVIVIKNPERESLSIIIKVVDSDFSVGSYKETHPYDDVYSASHSNSKDATRFSNDRLTVYAKASPSGPSENPFPPNERGRERGEPDESDDSAWPKAKSRLRAKLGGLYLEFLTGLKLNDPDTAMSKIGGPALRQLILDLADPDPQTRAKAVLKLAGTTDLNREDRIEKIAPFLKDPSEIVRILAAKTLAYLGDSRGIPLLKECLKHELDDTTRIMTAFYLAELGHLEAIPILISGLFLKDNFLRTTASQGLKAFGEISEKHRARLLEEVMALAGNKDKKERVKAARILRYVSDIVAIHELFLLFADPSPEVRREAASALGYQGIFFSVPSDDVQSGLLKTAFRKLANRLTLGEEENSGVRAVILVSLIALDPLSAIYNVIPDCLLRDDSKAVLEAAALAIDNVSDLFKANKVDDQTIMDIAMGLLLASNKIKKETLHRALAAMCTDPKAGAIIQRELNRIKSAGGVALDTAEEIQRLLDYRKEGTELDGLIKILNNPDDADPKDLYYFAPVLEAISQTPPHLLEKIGFSAACLDEAALGAWAKRMHFEIGDKNDETDPCLIRFVTEEKYEDYQIEWTVFSDGTIWVTLVKEAEGVWSHDIRVNIEIKNENTLVIDGVQQVEVKPTLLPKFRLILTALKDFGFNTTQYSKILVNVRTPKEQIPLDEWLERFGHKRE